MLREEMTQLDKEIYDRYNGWLTNEWNRCAQLRASFENHAITFLMTGNGGGAVAAITFSASAEYVPPQSIWALVAFLSGIFLCGVAIALGLLRMGHITQALADDHTAFNQNTLRSGQLNDNYHSRFKKTWYADPFGWLSSVCLCFGLVMTVPAYQGYLDFKAQKAAAQQAAASSPKGSEPRSEATTSERTWRQSDNRVKTPDDKNLKPRH